MSKYILGLLSFAILLSCTHPGNKVTYYEQHDYCELMKILDSSMALSKLQFTNDNDFDLATALKMHHQCSIELVDYETEIGENEKMIAIANRILQTDSSELLLIDSFIHSHPVQHNSTGNSIDYKIKRAIDKMQHTADLQLLTDDDDHDFGILILPQRQCNADLAELILHHSSSPLLKQIAANMLEGSSLETELLQLSLTKYINK